MSRGGATGALQGFSQWSLPLSFPAVQRSLYSRRSLLKRVRDIQGWFWGGKRMRRVETKPSAAGREAESGRRGGWPEGSRSGAQQFTVWSPKASEEWGECRPSIGQKDQNLTLFCSCVSSG